MLDLAIAKAASFGGAFVIGAATVAGASESLIVGGGTTFALAAVGAGGRWVWRELRSARSDRDGLIREIGDLKAELAAVRTELRIMKGEE